MQRSLECPVCTNVYSIRGRTPKSLFCGHGFCSMCLENMMKRLEIVCPNCRRPCIVPEGNVEKLPTNYTVLDILNCACVECMDKPYTRRCDHCSKNLCDDCRHTHTGGLNTDRAAELLVLKELAFKLSDASNDCSDFDRMKTRRVELIQDLTRSHQENISKLEVLYNEHLTLIKETSEKDEETFQQWQISLQKELEDIKPLLDESQTNPPDVSKKIDSLKAIEKARPKPKELNFSYCDDYFHQMMSKCRRHLRRHGDTSSNELTDLSSYVSEPSDYMAVRCASEYSLNLQRPTGVTVHPDTGDVIVTDHWAHNIHLLSDSLQLLNTIGSHGDGKGEFDGPFDVAVSDRGEIYITDMSNHRVQVSNHVGSILFTFGAKGATDDCFNEPKGIVFDTEHRLYICDSLNHRIKVTNRQGKFLDSFGQDLFFFSTPPRFIALSQNSELVVTQDSGNICFFSTDGQAIRTIKGRAPPHCIDYNGVTRDQDGNLLFSDYGGRLVVMRAGQILFMQNETGETLEHLGQLDGVAITRKADIVVCDGNNSKVKLFTMLHNI